MTRAFIMALLATTLLVASSGAALAGPPFVTDDPEPAEYQHFEINSAWESTYSKHTTDGAVPCEDINYGAGPDLQLHLGLSMPYHKDPFQSLAYGLGDVELGVKFVGVLRTPDDLLTAGAKEGG